MIQTIYISTYTCSYGILWIINQLSNNCPNICQKKLPHTNAIFGVISIWFRPGIYTRANTESYKDLGDKNRRIQEGQYVTVLIGRWDFKRSIKVINKNVIKGMFHIDPVTGPRPVVLVFRMAV